MNLEIEKIKKYLELNHKNSSKSFSKLSEDSTNHSPLVNNSNLAYSFDEITNFFYPNPSHKSADAIYLKDEVYLIEFKRGVLTGKNKKALEIKYSIKIKMSTSLHVLEKEVFALSSVNPQLLKKNFILVLDNDSYPIEAVSVVTANLSGLNDMSSTVSCFKNYGMPDIFGNFIFFDKVEVWNNLNFNSNFSNIH